MNTLPKQQYWYHATSIDCVANILKEGLRAGGKWGTYFANTEQYAADFARQNFNVPPMGTPTQYQQQYGIRHAPTANTIAVFKIATHRIPHIEISRDHTAVFRPRDLICAVTYTEEDIPITEADVCGTVYQYTATKWVKDPDRGGSWRCVAA